MPTLLDALLYDSAKKVEDFYQKCPFSLDKLYQYPGNVIQYLLMELAKIDTNHDHDNHSQSYWVSYKQTVLYKIYALFQNLTLKSNYFSAKDSASALYRLSMMHTQDLRSIPLNVPIFLALVEALYDARNHANSEDVSNVLWGIAKLIEDEIVIPINPQHIEAFIAIIVDVPRLAKPQEIFNSLWAVVKLINKEIIPAENLNHIDTLQRMLENTRPIKNAHDSQVSAKQRQIPERVSRKEFRLAYGYLLTNLNQDGLTPLHLALSVGDRDEAMEYLEYLREAYYDGIISRKTYRNLLISATPEKLTPLQLAVQRGNGPIIEYLIHELTRNFNPSEVIWHLILAIRDCADIAIKEDLQKKKEVLISLRPKVSSKTLLFMQKDNAVDGQEQSQQSQTSTLEMVCM